MKIDITSLDGSSAGSVELQDDIFGLEPREDLIARMIRYQLAKRRAGTHAVKNRADIARTGKKMYKSFAAMRMICPRRFARLLCATLSRSRQRAASSSSGRTRLLLSPRRRRCALSSTSLVSLRP